MGRWVLWLAVAGCKSSSALGVGGTAGGGFTVTASSEIGVRVGENVELGLTSNLHLGNWDRAGDAYDALYDWAASGSVKCCGNVAPLLTFFKYVGVGVGYVSAWVVATDATMTGPRLRYYVNQYAPTLYFDLGVGPAIFFHENETASIGVGSTVAAGYMFDSNWGLEARTTWGYVNNPEFATFTVGLVIKPKKRVFGLFGSNDLERPPPPPPTAPVPPAPASVAPGATATF